MKLLYAKLTHILFGWRWACVRVIGDHFNVCRIVNLGGKDMALMHGSPWEFNHGRDGWMVFGDHK